MLFSPFYWDKPRGHAFVEFETIEDANSAVDNMHNSELLGKVISCSTAKATGVSSRGKPGKRNEKKTQVTPVF